MVVKFLVGEEDGSDSEWVDMYIDECMIGGFYLPSDYDMDIDKCLNVLYCGQFYAFKQTAELLEYLTDRFVCVK